MAMNASTTTSDPTTIRLTVAIEALIYPELEAGGFSAEVPALPGCYTEGETLDEVRANLKEAAEAWLGSAHDRAKLRLVDPTPAA
jgi:predicted RNase H-like HicB family nuclease